MDEAKQAFQRSDRWFWVTAFSKADFSRDAAPKPTPGTVKQLAKADPLGVHNAC